MNEIIKQEHEHYFLDLKSRATNVVADTETGRIRNQKIVLAGHFKEDGATKRISVELRFDDECNNGHESFAITASIYHGSRWEAGGCLHGEIAKHFPTLEPLIKWHLMSTDGPLHYIANTVYHAGDRDHHGLLKGEKRQIKNGRTGEPAWHLVAVTQAGEEIELYRLEKNIDGNEKPDCPYTLEYRPWCNVGEGKDRDLDAARSSAVWPEATDEQLSAPKDELTNALANRLPGLLAEFKAAMLECGFLWPEKK